MTGRLRGAPVLGLAAAIVGSGAYLLILQSHITFFADDWNFIVDRRGFSVGAFLDPHNDHIALAPVAIYKALMELFGTTSAVPFQVVSTFVFVLSVVLLFVYVRRRVGDWLALLACVLILFLGAAWTDLLWSFQIGFSGSMAAGIGALLALERDSRRGDVTACALLVAATAFSELGIPFAVGALVNVALGPGPRLRRLYVPLVPAILYGLWYLGWGHTGLHTASFENFLNSPKFIFELISENLASLLGIAPLFSHVSSTELGGLGWGELLLVIAIALTAWWLWRKGRPTRSLWTVAAAGGAFWLLTAVNANVLFRTPTTGRYQYPGAVFVLLIAAELLRGIRVDRRALVPAAAVTLAAAVSGIVLLHDGYDFRREASDDLRARLAAVEIGQGHEVPHAVVFFHLFVASNVSDYLSTVDEFGSPAFSQEQLMARGEADRAAADGQLASVEGIKLQQIALGAGPGAQPSGACQVVNGSASNAATALGPGNYALRTRGQPAAGGQQSVTVRAARFADGPNVDLGFVGQQTESTLDIPQDPSAVPWRLYWPAGSAGTVCRVSP